LRFIQNPLYEELIPSTILLLEKAYPSRFILVIIALVFGEAAYFIFGKLGKETPIDIYTNIHHYPLPHKFHDEDIHSSIRYWITLWMSRAQEFLSQEESSAILTQKTSTLLHSTNSRSIAQESMKVFFVFFLASKNIVIDSKKADLYAEFIISEYEKTLDIFLLNVDKELA
jgi:hypothetical protein